MRKTTRWMLLGAGALAAVGFVAGVLAQQAEERKAGGPIREEVRTFLARRKEAAKRRRQPAAEAEAVPECAADTETAGAAESTGAETEEQNCGAPQEKTANNTTAEEEMPVVPEDKEEPLK